MLHHQDAAVWWSCRLSFLDSGVPTGRDQIQVPNRWRLRRPQVHEHLGLLQMQRRLRRLRLPDERLDADLAQSISNQCCLLHRRHLEHEGFIWRGAAVGSFQYARRILVEIADTLLINFPLNYPHRFSTPLLNASR